MECNHATILHSARVVDNALEWKDNLFIEEINNWAKIFTEVMPNSEETKSELVETINNHLNTTMLSLESKLEVLNEGSLLMTNASSPWPRTRALATLFGEETIMVALTAAFTVKSAELSYELTVAVPPYATVFPDKYAFPECCLTLTSSTLPLLLE